MADFAKKVLVGQQTTAAEWNQYLIEMHQRAPSQTPKAFAAYQTKDFRNSYEILASVLSEGTSENISVLDLACGDGYLFSYIEHLLTAQSRIIGVDMSEGELSIARKKYAKKNIEFLCSNAVNLPLENQTVDVVLCHMAFMLMNPIEAVVREISRVLKPRGIFSFVVGNPSKMDEFLRMANQSLTDFQKREFPKIAESFQGGDSRSRTVDGVRELFNDSTGFSGLETRFEFELQISIPPENIFSWFEDWYNVSLMPAASQAQWKTELVKLAQGQKNSQSKLEFQFPMQRFVVRK